MQPINHNRSTLDSGNKDKDENLLPPDEQDPEAKTYTAVLVLTY